MHFLVILTGKHKGRQIELPEREVWIGRDDNCLVRMTSSEVSRRHCSLTPTGRGLLLRDLNSQNFTRLGLGSRRGLGLGIPVGDVPRTEAGCDGNQTEYQT